ncbi:MAG TPA: M48 family metallopeptidase [Pyrinomonadaceae bacterium]|jgi:predicted Zn-dependent protease|nr:M48 family metallopeptidase [Pyrinomonadaceae bacterium]
MYCHSPARRKLSAFIPAFIIALIISHLSLTAFAQRHQTRPRRETATQPAGSTLPTLVTLGSDVVNSATRIIQDDPYAEFRDARYSNAGLLSERDETRLGQQLHVEVGKRYRLTNDGLERANRIGQRVARKSLRPTLVYHFYVIEDNQINAFSGPGGYVYVTTALMKLANDDELASVLSHEVGHVVARHSLKSLQQRQAVGGLADLVGSITGVAGDAAQELGKTAAQMVGSGLLAVHSREEEREADFLGVRGMFKAGFNAEGMITMFQKLQSISQSDASLLGTLFRDHPDVQERIDNTRYEITRLRRAPSRANGR